MWGSPGEAAVCAGDRDYICKCNLNINKIVKKTPTRSYSSTLIRVMVRLSGVAWNHLIEDTMQLWSTAHRNSALKYISLRKHQIGMKEMVDKMRRR